MFDGSSVIQSENYEYVLVNIFFATWYFAFAFCTVATQYVVALWIRKAKTGQKGVPDPISKLTFCSISAALFSVIFFMISGKCFPIQTNCVAHTRYYTPIVAVLGTFAYLISFSVTDYLSLNSGSKPLVKGPHSDIRIEKETVEVAQNNKSNLENDAELALEDKSADLSSSNSAGKDVSELLVVDLNKNKSSSKKQDKDLKFYLNNLKVFIMFMVICAHGAEMLVVFSSPFQFHLQPFNIDATSVNVSSFFSSLILIGSMVTNMYALGLFFFISGYFTPASVNRKGNRAFLFDRVKRLGIPFCLAYYFWSPYVDMAFVSLMLTGEYVLPLASAPVYDDLLVKNSYYMIPGVAWFNILLIFLSFLYVFVCGERLTMNVKYPGIYRIYFWVTVIGWVSAYPLVLLLGVNIQSFWFGIPLFSYRIFLYSLCYFGGAVAGQNKWLDEMKDSLCIRDRVVAYLLLILFFAAFGVYQLFIAPSDFKLTSSVEMSSYGYYAVLVVFEAGLGQAIVCTALIIFFMDFMNWKNKLSLFFWASSYTAYLFQRVFLYIGFVAVVALNNRIDEEFKIEFNAYDKLYGLYDFNHFVPYWLLMVAIAHLLLWPAAFGLRSIPGFSQVL